MKAFLILILSAFSAFAAEVLSPKWMATIDAQTLDPGDYFTVGDIYPDNTGGAAITFYSHNPGDSQPKYWFILWVNSSGASQKVFPITGAVPELSVMVVSPSCVIVKLDEGAGIKLYKKQGRSYSQVVIFEGSVADSEPERSSKLGFFTVEDGVNPIVRFYKK